MPSGGDGRVQAWSIVQDSRHYNKIGNVALKQTYSAMVAALQAQLMIDPTRLDGEAQLLVVAENLLARAGLTALLEERGCQVLASTDGADPQADIDRFQPDALVVDVGWDSSLMRRRLSQD